MDANEIFFGIYQVFIKPSKGIPSILMHYSIKNSTSKFYILQKFIAGENEKNLYQRRYSLKFKTSKFARTETEAIFPNHYGRNALDFSPFDCNADGNLFLNLNDKKSR